MWLEHYGTHRFVLSPPGHGLDCHRTWEAILLGAIPIVVDCAYLRAGSHLVPIIPPATVHKTIKNGYNNNNNNNENVINNGLFRQGLYDNLPVLVLSDWSEVCNTSLLEEEGKRLRKRFDEVPQRLSLKRWIEKEERALMAEEEG